MESATTWLRVGHATDFVAERLTVRRLLGRTVGIRRLADGSLEGLELACRHQGFDLSEGYREGSLVTCPMHGWRYDLATGACLTHPELPLRRIGVEEREGVVWVDPRPREAGSAPGGAALPGRLA